MYLLSRTHIVELNETKEHAPTLNPPTMHRSWYSVPTFQPE